MLCSVSVTASPLSCSSTQASWSPTGEAGSSTGGVPKTGVPTELAAAGNPDRRTSATMIGTGPRGIGQSSFRLVGAPPQAASATNYKPSIAAVKPVQPLTMLTRWAGSGWRIERWVEAPGAQPRCLRQIDVVNQELLLAVGDIGEALPFGTEEAGRRVLVAHRVIDAGEIDRVLDAARHHRLLVVGRCGISPSIDGCATAVTARELRVEDKTGAAGRRPAHAFRVAPPLMADRDSERDPIDLEEPALTVGDIERFFFEGDLILRLVAGNLAVTRDDERHVMQSRG